VASPAAGRPLCLIVNPHAGGRRAERLLPGVEVALRELGVAFRVERTRSLEHGRALARAGRDAGEVVAAMGGDGLTGAVAGELRGSDALLVVLPGGRGNDFARKLGIPQDPVAACELIAAGRERRVDVAEADGRTYLGILSAGFDSDAQDVVAATRLPLGGLVYAYGAVRALVAWRPARWEVTIDGAARSFTGYSVAVANSGVYGSGMWLAPQASVDDGQLDVVLTEDRPRPSYLRAMPKVFSGAHVAEPGFHVLPAREVSFHADRPFTAYADGDPIVDLPTTVRVVPGALRVLAPAASS
jgi:YegS/Rv2252/BmrU family lipid kinase